MTIEARIERAVGLALLHELNRARSGPTDAVSLRRAWESGGGAADEIRTLARAVLEGPGTSVDVAAVSRKLFREAPICVGDAVEAPAPWTRPGAGFRDWVGAEKVRSHLADTAREKADAMALPTEAVIGDAGEDPLIVVGASARSFVHDLALRDSVVWPEELWRAGLTIDATPTWEAAAHAADAGTLCQACGLAAATDGARCAACEAVFQAGSDFPGRQRLLWVSVARPAVEGDGEAGGSGVAPGLIARTRGRARAAETWRAVHAGLMTFVEPPFAVWILRDAIHFVLSARPGIRALSTVRGADWLFDVAGKTTLGQGVACVEAPIEVPLWRVAQLSSAALEQAVARAREVRGEFVATVVADRSEFGVEPLVLKREDWRTLTLLGSKLGALDRRTRRHLFSVLSDGSADVDFAFRYEIARTPRLRDLARAGGIHEVFGRTHFPLRVAWAENVSEEGRR